MLIINVVKLRIIANRISGHQALQCHSRIPFVRRFNNRWSNMHPCLTPAMQLSFPLLQYSIRVSELVNLRHFAHLQNNYVKCLLKINMVYRFGRLNYNLKTSAKNCLSASIFSLQIFFHDIHLSYHLLCHLSISAIMLPNILHIFVKNGASI